VLLAPPFDTQEKDLEGAVLTADEKAKLRTNGAAQPKAIPAIPRPSKCRATAMAVGPPIPPSRDAVRPMEAPTPARLSRWPFPSRHHARRRPPGAAGGPGQGGRGGFNREDMLKRFDKDGDGELSEEERNAMRQQLGGSRTNRGDRARGGGNRWRRRRNRRRSPWRAPAADAAVTAEPRATAAAAAAEKTGLPPRPRPPDRVAASPGVPPIPPSTQPPRRRSTHRLNPTCATHARRVRDHSYRRRRETLRPRWRSDVLALRGVHLKVSPRHLPRHHGTFRLRASPPCSNILGCLDRPSSGSYWLGGENVATMPDDQLSEARGLKIGFIFQSYNLIAQLTVIENIQVPLLYQGTRRPPVPRALRRSRQARRTRRTPRPSPQPVVRWPATARRHRPLTRQ
jgi:hypothetical protein